MALLLSTPEQHSFQDPTLELDDKRLQKWLGGLPVLDTGSSLRMVLDALEPLNEQTLESKHRLRLLSVYLPTVQRLYDTAQPARLRQANLSRQQRQDTVDDIERLCLAMANGFKIIVKEWCAPGQPAGKQPLLGTVLRWCLQQLTQALVHSFRFYRPEPAWVFLELNQLYRLARHHGLVDQVSKGDSSGVQITLAGIYQAICLLALIDPFSQEEGELDRQYRALMQYAPQARIIPGNSWQGVPEGLYVLDLQSDLRPRHCVFLQSPVDGDDPYLLDARVPLQQMHRTLASLNADRRKRRPEAAILRALLPEVIDRDKRRGKRRTDGSWIEVVIGLDGIVDWLLRQQCGEQPEGIDWQVLDRSEQGYRLTWENSDSGLLQVGELVCEIERDTDDKVQALRLFLVRWLRDERGKGTELGVERIQGVPGPVRLEVPEPGDEAPVAALFLPAPKAGIAAVLIAPCGIHRDGRALKIHAGTRTIPVCCGVRLQQGAGIELFEFLAGEN